MALRNKILIGMLVALLLIVVVFTVAPFGVDTNTVGNSYLSLNGKYGIEKSALKVTVDTYKEIVDAKVEEFNEAIEAGDMDEDYNYLYTLPFKLEGKDFSTLTMSVDLGVYSVTDDRYNSSAGCHYGQDLIPNGPGWLNESNFSTVKIIAPCSGTVQQLQGAISLNEIDLVTADYTFRFIHCSKIEKSLIGQKVEKGTVLGEIGDWYKELNKETGQYVDVPNLPHLHFSVYNTNGSYAKPLNAFSLGKWDMQDVDFVMYNVIGNRNDVNVTTFLAGVSPLTMSYLENLRNVNSIAYTIGYPYTDDSTVFKYVLTDDNKLDLQLLNRNNLQYLPSVPDKSWYPKGVG